MSKSIEVQSPDLGYINFVLSYEDEQGSPASKTFRLVYTYRAIRLAEESLGIDLKDFSKWAEVKSSMTPKLVLAGLAACHPEVTLEWLESVLNPSVQGAIQDAVFSLLFPGVLEKLQAAKDKADKEALPNAQAAASADA